MDPVLYPPRLCGPQPVSGTLDQVAAAAGFVDRTLQNEGAWYRADDVEARLGGQLASYGSSVGAVRGTVRDALRKYKELDHDAVVHLASALWGQPAPVRGPFLSAGSLLLSCCNPPGHSCAIRT